MAKRLTEQWGASRKARRPAERVQHTKPLTNLLELDKNIIKSCKNSQNFVPQIAFFEMIQHSIFNTGIHKSSLACNWVGVEVGHPLMDARWGNVHALRDARAVRVDGRGPADLSRRTRLTETFIAKF